MSESDLIPYRVILRNLHCFEDGAVVLFEESISVKSPFPFHPDGRVYALQGLSGLQKIAVNEFAKVGFQVTATDATSMPRAQVFPVVDNRTGRQYHARVQY